MSYFEMGVSGVSSILPELARNLGGTRKTQEYRASVTELLKGTQEYRVGITELSQKTSVSAKCFSDMLQTTGETKGASVSDLYQQYLKQKYGTVTHYVSGDLKPEVRARIEAQMKAEAEEKTRRKRMYQKRSEEVAGLRRQEMELAYRKQSMLGDILI